MKIITNNGLYIQKKDLDLIFKSTNHDQIPQSIFEIYKQNDTKDIGFILVKDDFDINFLNGFWFVLNYGDVIELNELEIGDYRFQDLQNLRQMRVEFDKNRYLPPHKVYDNSFEVLLDQLHYTCYLPPKDEVPNYPIIFQLLYNKVSDVDELNSFKRGISDLELPEEVFKPVRYSKKQLQQIYYEVLGEDLTFEELKPYQTQLYSIFSRINYTPNILDIIRKIMLINRYNTVDFINDDLLDLLLRIEGRKSKFEESAPFLIDYLYAIGYNQFRNFESKVVLEKDLKIVKTAINYISRANITNKDIEKLTSYNYILGEIIKKLKECNFSSNHSRFIRESFLYMTTFVYFNPDAINYDFDFLVNVYQYLCSNSSELKRLMGENFDKLENHNEHFIENFNCANSLLLYLFNQMYEDYSKNKIFSSDEPSSSVD